MFKDPREVTPAQAETLRDLGLQLIDVATPVPTRNRWRKKVRIGQATVEVTYVATIGYDIEITRLKGWVRLYIAPDRVRLLEPPRCFDFAIACGELTAAAVGWAFSQPALTPSVGDLVSEEVKRLMEEGASEEEAYREVTRLLEVQANPPQHLYPSLSDKEAWLKRYQQVHNVDATDAQIEYRRRRRVMNLFDIKFIEYFSSIDEDPTEPDNLKKFMEQVKNG